MSYSTVMAISPGEQTPPEVLKGLRNSHGSALLAWNVMSKRFGIDDLWGNPEGMHKLWAYHKDPSLPRYQRAVLMMTFDYAYVRKEHFALAAADIREWIKDFVPDPGFVNHWPAIAEIYESQPDCEAIAIHQTSVSENPFDFDLDDEGEVCLPFDWTKTYEIYETLAETEEDRT